AGATRVNACTLQSRQGLLLVVDIAWLSAPGVAGLTGNRRLFHNSCRCVYLPSIPSELVADNAGGISTHCLNYKQVYRFLSGFISSLLPRFAGKTESGI